MPSRVVEELQPLVLYPFDPGSAPEVNLAGAIFRQDDRLKAEFRLAGTGHLHVPSLSSSPFRGDDLWKQTCFELFLASTGSESYREVNLCPSGAWNLYRFDRYRQGMREETIDCLRYRFLPEADILVLRIEIDLNPLRLKDKALKVNPCAVLLSREKKLSHWAFSHPGSRLDFHDRQTWPSPVA